jgi:hypothetical protein
MNADLGFQLNEGIGQAAGKGLQAGDSVSIPIMLKFSCPA